MVKPRGFQPRNCGFESRPDLHGPVAQQAEHATDNREVDRSNRSRSTTSGSSSIWQSTCLGRRGLQVQVLPSRPTSETRKAGVLIGLENRDARKGVGVRSSQSPPYNGVPSLIGKAPGRDPGRCRFESGGSPQIRRSGRAVKGTRLLNERGASPALVRIQASPPIRGDKQDEMIDSHLDCRCKFKHLPVAQLEQSGWLRTSRSGVRVFPGRPHRRVYLIRHYPGDAAPAVLGISVVHRAFNPERKVRFLQGGPRGHSSVGRARRCQRRGRGFDFRCPHHVIEGEVASGGAHNPAAVGSIPAPSTTAR